MHGLTGLIRHLAIVAALALAFGPAATPGFAASGKSHAGPQLKPGHHARAGGHKRFDRPRLRETVRADAPKYASGRRTDRDFRLPPRGWRDAGRRHDAPPAFRHHDASGVKLASGRNTTYRHRVDGRRGRHEGYGFHRRHAGREGGARVIDVAEAIADVEVNQVAIAVVAGAVAAPGPAEAAPAAECNADGYCAVRLGPYSNSPKIITLRARAEAAQPAETPVDEAGPGEAELKRRYGDK